MTPEQLFDLSVKYFEWAEDNAIKASESASFQGGVYESLVHKPRVFTWTGYRLFIGASEAAIIKWKREEEYSEVMEFVESVINEQNFSLPQTALLTPHLSVRISESTSQPQSTSKTRQLQRRPPSPLLRTQ